MYCDYLLANIDYFQEAQYICHIITEILKSGGFIFRKWPFNKPVLEFLAKDDISNKILYFDSNDYTKTYFSVK